MLIVGLVGGSGSGKSMVGDIFHSAGYIVYDTDAVYHAMTSERSDCTAALADAFGDDILNEDGSLNRRILSDIVFAPGKAAEDARHLLNRIAHSHVRHAFELFLATQEEDAKIILDAPLLFEAGMDAICDVTLALTAPREARICRIMERDALTREAAERRIDSQMTDDALVLKCDLHIENDGLLSTLKNKTEKIIEIIHER